MKTLSLCSREYQWKKADADGSGYCDDGPILLKLLLDEIDPSTEIGTEMYRKQIQNARLNKFDFDMKKARDEVEFAFRQIVLRGETYDSLRLHVFDLLLSARNSEFLTWVQRVKQDVNTATGDYGTRITLCRS